MHLLMNYRRITKDIRLERILRSLLKGGGAIRLSYRRKTLVEREALPHRVLNRHEMVRGPKKAPIS